MPAMRPMLTAMLAAALLLPATASATPGDPPVEAVFPADGAVLPVNDGRHRVALHVPVAVPRHGTFPTFGGREDYGVYFATSPALGNDGRLLQSALVDIGGPDEVQDNDIPVGQCRAYMSERAPPRSRPRARTTGRPGGCASTAQATTRSRPSGRSA